MITYLKNVRLVSKDHLALKELSEIYDRENLKLN
jgi:hypothetical protein